MWAPPETRCIGHMSSTATLQPDMQEDPLLQGLPCWLSGGQCVSDSSLTASGVSSGAVAAPAEVVGVLLVMVVRDDGVEAGHEDEQDGHLQGGA